MIIADQIWTGIKTTWNGVTGFFDGMMDGWGGFADFVWPWLPIAGVVAGGLALGGVGGMAIGGLAGLGVTVAGGAAVGLINGVWRGGSDAAAVMLSGGEETEQAAAEEAEKEQEVAAQVTPDARDKKNERAVG